MARINFMNPSDKTRNYHFNYLYPYHQLAKVLNDRGGDIFDRYNDTAASIQNKIIKKVAQENRRARMMGSKWSLSEAPYCKDLIIDVSSLNLVLPLTVADKHANNNDTIDNFSFVQGGKKIKSTTDSLERRGKSLKTSGASNGQTVSGAIATGVHGSAIDVGSVQDSVVGLNIITSDKKIVYIERASRPVLNDAFAAKIKSTVIRDDDMFNAALVGLGAFGFVIGVVLEVEDNYLLERHIIKKNRADTLALAKNHDFTTTNIPLPNPGERPYHYKFYMNPYKRQEDFIVEILYKRPFGPHESPIATIQGSYYGDLPSLVGKIVSIMSKSVATFANVLGKTIFPKATDPVKTGTLGEIFYNTNSKGSVFGTAVAVEHADCEQVLNIMSDIIVDMNVPGLLSSRFVKGTEATLGFTRFPNTAIVEVDGVQWKDLDKFIVRLTKALSDSALDFSLHWGKNADWKPALIDRMYGPRKTAWVNQRNQLVTAAMKKIFANKFLDDIGLS